MCQDQRAKSDGGGERGHNHRAARGAETMIKGTLMRAVSDVNGAIDT